MVDIHKPRGRWFPYAVGTLLVLIAIVLTFYVPLVCGLELRHASRIVSAAAAIACIGYLILALVKHRKSRYSLRTPLFWIIWRLLLLTIVFTIAFLLSLVCGFGLEDAPSAAGAIVGVACVGYFGFLFARHDLSRCRLRTLFTFLVVVGIGTGWFVVRMRSANKQQKTVAAIRSAGGRVRYDYQGDDLKPRTPPKPPGPPWLRRLLGDDFFTNVVGARVTNRTGLEHLKDLPKLRKLVLYGDDITNAGLEHIKGLTQLKKLQLHDTFISEAGLECLGGLTELQSLDIFGTEVSDAGLKHLKVLTQLRELSMGGNQITDDGLADFQALTKLRLLSVHSPRITDAGLEHFKGLSHLEGLDLLGSRVTKEGVKNLQQVLPKCWIGQDNRSPE